jgi:metal-dependent amidase/aminoacylase/carboxypeptidase family protein
MDTAALKHAVCDRVDELADRLLDASHQIHAHPELNYEEHFAHELLTGFLEREGIAPVRHAYDLATRSTRRSAPWGPGGGAL